MAKKVLVCALCSHSIEDKKVIHSFEHKTLHTVLHCTQCLSLHPTKKHTLKKWLHVVLKKPLMTKYFFKKEIGCCKVSECIPWNGYCPKCGSELTLKEAA